MSVFKSLQIILGAEHHQTTLSIKQFHLTIEIKLVNGLNPGVSVVRIV